MIEQLAVDITFYSEVKILLSNSFLTTNKDSVIAANDFYIFSKSGLSLDAYHVHMFSPLNAVEGANNEKLQAGFSERPQLLENKAA